MDSKKIKQTYLNLFSSWCWFDDSCPEVKEILRNKQELVPGGKHQCLWHTRSKYVLLVMLSDGREVVYKAPAAIKGVHKYLFRPGAYGMEAVNFLRLAEIGLPMVKLIAAGEDRCCFVLKSGFLVTEYASGFSNGRDFISGAALENENTLKDEFIRRNFVYLARMHNAGIIHRGFTPANLLYRKRNDPDRDGNLLDILWIDVASCKKCFAGLGLTKGIARDISLFFHYFDFDRDEKLRYISIYCSNDPAGRFTPGKLLELVEKNPVR